jgi:hypothetical protein
MLAHRHLPPAFVPRAFRYANMIATVIPKSRLGGRTAMQEYYCKDPMRFLARLRTFGSVTYFSPRSVTAKSSTPNRQLIFTGFKSIDGAYEAVDPKTQGDTSIYSWHALFNEAAVPSDWYQQFRTKPIGDILLCPPILSDAPPSGDLSSNLDVSVTKVSAISKPPSVKSETIDVPAKPLDRSSLTRKCKINGRAYSKYSTADFEAVGMYNVADPTQPTDSSDVSALRAECFLTETKSPAISAGTTTAGETSSTGASYFACSFASESMVSTDDSEKIRHETLKRESYPPARTIPTPKSLAQARKSEYWPEWSAAYDMEIKNLSDHNTFKFEPEREGAFKLGCKVVFKVKHDQNGKVTRFKCRLVVQGYNQIEHMHFEETFAPVAYLSTILLVLVMACAFGLDLFLLDFLGAFLHSLMPDRFPVYIKTPEGIHVPDGFMVRLHKSLYGTRNAGHLWWKDLRKALLELGYSQCPFDQCLFYRIRADGTMTFLATWVDDVIIATNDPEINKLKEKLEAMGFRIQTLEHLEWYLGLGIEFTDTHLIINQEAYIDKLLERFALDKAHAVSTPMLKCTFNVGASPPAPKGTPYRELLGGLNHLVRFSRCDGLFSVFFLARYQNTPTIAHWDALKRVLRYFKGTKGLRLRFRRGKCLDELLHISAWSDADFAGCKDTRKSTSGYIIQVNGAPVIVKSRKQRLTAQSVCESETIAAQDCTKDLVWLRGLLQWIFPNEELPPTDLHIDNQALIQIVNSEKNPSASKFFAIRQYFLKEHKASGDINPIKVPTEDNLADLFTKPLGRIKFEYFRDQIFGV